jgi:hypothetical protein
VSATRLELSREQALAHRRRVGLLDERVALDDPALRRAAWAGLTDSGPRAALLQLHARVAGVRPDALDDPSLSQVWGPRFSAYVVAEIDAPIFTLGRHPDEPAAVQRAQAMAERLDGLRAGGRSKYGAAGRQGGVNPNAFRYATTTGRVRIRWDGAHQPEVWMVPAPALDPIEARRELARRYLYVLGPGTAASFGEWAGIRAPRARSIFESVAEELVGVRTPAGEASILATDEASFRADGSPRAGVRLLPSGDAYWLMWGPDRALLVPDADQRGRLWTPRVWPGAILLDGQIVGTWRRGGAAVSADAWRPLTAPEREAVEAEAEGLPLGLPGPIRVRWEA